MINRTFLLFAIVFVIAWMVFRSQEKYQAGRTDYRYGFIDTNPARRVSDAFDSPEQINVYEGLPLP
jgi:hypothetical protein